jgi:heterodisulfide reductase subunit D
VDILVSACVWSERPLSQQGTEQEVEVYDLMEIVAKACGFEI